MTIAELVYAQVKVLPEPLAREVLEFVGRLRQRDTSRETGDLLAAQQTALTAIWDNDDDRVWDGL